MIKKNNKTVGFIYKNNQNIDKVYKGTDLVFEQGYTREQTGVPPITTTYQAIGKKLKDYKIYGNSIQGKLPSEYQQVEYIESTGTQYIDTGININTTTSRYETKINPSLVSGTMGIFGTRNYTSSNPSSMNVFIINGAFRLDWLTGAGNYNVNNISSNTEYTISITRGLATINDVDYTSEATTSIDGSYTFYIGNFNNAGSVYSNGFSGKIYYSKLYNNNILVFDGVPCYRNSDNEVGMYDLVTNTFFTNAGTGVFLKGSNALTPSAPIEIESVGDLITDTNDINYGKYKIPVIAKSKNLFDDTTLSNKWINVSGSVVDMPKTNCKRFECVEGETYTLSASYETQHANNIIVMAFYDSNDTLIRRNVVSNLQYEELIVTAPQNSKYLYAGHYTIEPQTIQLEKSDIATKYEPYVEPVITNIYLDEPLRKIEEYSDYIDFINGKVIRQLGEVVLNGSETWNKIYNSFQTVSNTTPNKANVALNSLSSHFIHHYYSTSITTNIQNGEFGWNSVKNLTVRNDNCNTTNELKTWLQSNNVTVDYVLETPTEETILLPNIPTIKGTTIFEIDTEIQPSSMYIKYKSK